MAVCASLRARPCWLLVVLSATQGRVVSRPQREGCLDQKRHSHILLPTQFDGEATDGSVRFEEGLKRHCHAAICFCERIPLLGSIFRKGFHCLAPSSEDSLFNYLLQGMAAFVRSILGVAQSEWLYCIN
ncbi:hypothetical protein GOP47_0005371 [Adiantum capillus-veneris]|uniref:Secreted protein n=1 Tax=Adiantum capillus-veneris TaxID=13818 RepID=A0A9D4V5P8_ADICA|nr:hypothetical protein GOP47_0005371 [Adiantum capillus-veneris]